MNDSPKNSHLPHSKRPYLNTHNNGAKAFGSQNLNRQTFNSQTLNSQTFNCQEHAQQALVKCIKSAQREVCILCHWLDPKLYDTEAFCTHLSRIARRHRNSRIRILIHNPKPLYGRKHSIVTLSQRLSSSVEIRVITKEHAKPNTAFCICDNAAMVFFHLETANQGFLNLKASAKSHHALNEFNHLWLHYSAQDSELKALIL